MTLKPILLDFGSTELLKLIQERIHAHFRKIYICQHAVKYYCQHSESFILASISYICQDFVNYVCLHSRKHNYQYCGSYNCQHFGTSSLSAFRKMVIVSIYYRISGAYNYQHLEIYDCHACYKYCLRFRLKHQFYLVARRPL